jgi:WD40 repeat protein
MVAGPRRDPWTAAIYAAAAPEVPIGSGFVLDESRVLTCRHVIEKTHAAATPLLVAFPKSGLPRGVRRGVRGVRNGRDDVDVSVLELGEPAPPEAAPAPLRSPQPADLVGDRWWTFGFPKESQWGADAHGVVGAWLAYGGVRLETQSRYGVKRGFSGAALWSTEFQAVVGIVVQAQGGGDYSGDALAITLHEVARSLPEEDLPALAAWSVAAAGETALEAWGWALDRDEESVRHWRPRARGVSSDAEGGYRFRGRTAALRAVVGWLQRPQPNRQVLVVTGSPGVGKSAVLGRVVTTADAGVRAALPPGDHNVRAPVGAIACAVHAKGKTALDVAGEIARAASVRVPRNVDDLVPALARRLAQRRDRRPFNLVVDALDEASSPQQARTVISAVLLPITRFCARYGAQAVVGSRRRDDGGSLLAAFGGDLSVVDLDETRYFAEADLAEYALATLAMVGNERAGNPYADPAAAAPFAQRIAELADRNFLIAGLIARAHGLYDTSPADPADLSFTPTVDAALTAYLSRLPPVGLVPATVVLSALAYAEAPGLSAELWRLALAAMRVDVGVAELTEFMSSSAANFIVESSDDGGLRRYRLFHQALSDALLRDRDHMGAREEDLQALAQHFIAHGRRRGWEGVDPYLFRTLPAYAHRAGVIDDLLTDDQFLLHTDLPRLTQFAEHARSAAGFKRSRLLYLTPQASTASGPERAALFGVTAEMEGLGPGFTGVGPVPYRARWAAVARRTERAALDGHAGTIRSLCPVYLGNQLHLAMVGDYRFARLWNPTTGRHSRLSVAPPGHDGDDPVRYAVCAVYLDGRPHLAVGGKAGDIHLTDATTGRVARSLRGHTGPVRALNLVTVEQQTYLVSGGDDGVVRIWDLARGLSRPLAGHTGAVRSIATRNGRRPLIISAGNDRTARLWDAVTGQAVRTLQPHIDDVRAVCFVSADGRTYAATANFREVVLWDLRRGTPAGTMAGHREAIRGMASVAVRGHDLLVTVAADGDIRIWDPFAAACLQVLPGHTDTITAVCAFVAQDRALLATGSQDRTSRLWDLHVEPEGPAARPHAHRAGAVVGVRAAPTPAVATVDGSSDAIRLRDLATGRALVTLHGRLGPVTQVCSVRHHGRDIIAAVCDGTLVRFWDPLTRGQLRFSLRPYGQVRAICGVQLGDGDSLLAISAGGRRAFQLWQPARERNTTRWSLPGLLAANHAQAHIDGVRALHHLTVDGKALLATAADDAAVLLWDLDGRQVGALRGHRGPVLAVTSVRAGDDTIVAAAGQDQTVRTWDAGSRERRAVLAAHTNTVTALCPVTVDGRAMLASGSLDRTVKIWDPEQGALRLSVPVHHPVLACAEVSGLLVVGLTAGVLALDLHPR